MSAAKKAGAMLFFYTKQRGVCRRLAVARGVNAPPTLRGRGGVQAL